ncbi:MAG TPA: DUF2062 domain-containing protein [Terracidiphilus sp.]|nr:DUF2062 domain-containing protein [Terracidiphilus sp.]
MQRWLQGRKGQLAGWLRQGISPRRLALTLALGFAIGCLPVLGIPTLLCALLAIVLRLNAPAIQAANYAAMPLQVALMLPLVRLGDRLFGWGPKDGLTAGLLHAAPWQLVRNSGGLAGEALAAWLLVAVPTVALMTLGLTLLLRRVPAVADRRVGESA